MRFGSSLLLIALRMRSAWNFANLVLEAISGSASFFHMDRISRNVEAARSVSTVLLVETISIYVPIEVLYPCIPVGSVL